MALAALYGFIWGFALCFTFGPAFFAIIQISIDSSLKKGLVMSLGVVAADAILMFFAVFGTAMLPQIQYFDTIIAVFGALLLLFMGLLSIFSKGGQLVYPKSKLGNIFYFFSKGLSLNISNPANFLFVVSTCTYLRATLKYDNQLLIIFFLLSMLATFAAQALIAFYANKLKKTINPKLIRRINLVAGMAFVLLALRLLWNLYTA